MGTGEEMLGFTRKAFIQLWHPASACKTGREGISDVVVDSEMGRRAVSGLRLVDASVFPLFPSGDPQVTVYAIAEKIAEDILNGN